MLYTRRSFTEIVFLSFLFLGMLGLLGRVALAVFGENLWLWSAEMIKAIMQGPIGLDTDGDGFG